MVDLHPTSSTAPLATWREGPVKSAILRFVQEAQSMPESDRVAVFDNDGTLWCEKPMPIQLDFILRRLVEMAEADPELPGRQPWKAAAEGDYAWFGRTLAEHYAGDDTNVKVLGAGVLGAFGNQSVEEFAGRAEKFLRTARHPTLDRGYLECAYAPMVELLQLLAANGFTNYIVSGGGRDFMRPISQELYGVEPQRVIGSSAALQYVADAHGGTVMRTAAADYIDDGPEKPVRIWSRVGRRPMFAAGNSNGDVPMLDYSQPPDRPCMRVLVLHDDDEREFAYTSGAEEALSRASDSGWTVASIREDWDRVF